MQEFYGGTLHPIPIKAELAVGASVRSDQVPELGFTVGEKIVVTVQKIAADGLVFAIDQKYTYIFAKADKKPNFNFRITYVDNQRMRGIVI